MGTRYGSMGTSAGSAGGKKRAEVEKKKTVGATDWEREAWEEGWGGGDWETGQQAKAKEQVRQRRRRRLVVMVGMMQSGAMVVGMESGLRSTSEQRLTRFQTQ